MARRRFAAIALATGSVIGTVAMRRRRARTRTRADLYFDDGSMLSLSDDAPLGAPLVEKARAVIAAGA